MNKYISYFTTTTQKALVLRHFNSYDGLVVCLENNRNAVLLVVQMVCFSGEAGV